MYFIHESMIWNFQAGCLLQQRRPKFLFESTHQVDWVWAWEAPPFYLTLWPSRELAFLHRKLTECENWNLESFACCHTFRITWNREWCKTYWLSFYCILTLLQPGAVSAVHDCLYKIWIDWRILTLHTPVIFLV